MGPKSIEQAVQLSFLQPEDGKHVQLSPEETAYLISRSAYKQLKEQNTLLETRIAQLLSMMDKPLETEQKG